MIYRSSRLLLYIVFVATSLGLNTAPVFAAQTARSCTAQRQVYLSYSNDDVRAPSPNGELDVVVTGEKKSLKAWVTLIQNQRGLYVQAWPIERNVDVLWKPDSRVFALTDNRYANNSYVILVGTKFRTTGKHLGLRFTNLTPLVRRALQARAKRYYRFHFDTSSVPVVYSLYAKALCWMPKDYLLVGVVSITSLPMPPPKFGRPRGVKLWERGYVVSVSDGKIVRSLNKEATRREFGVDLSEGAKNN